LIRSRWGRARRLRTGIVGIGGTRAFGGAGIGG